MALENTKPVGVEGTGNTSGQAKKTTGNKPKDNKAVANETQRNLPPVGSYIPGMPASIRTEVLKGGGINPLQPNVINNTGKVDLEPDLTPLDANGPDFIVSKIKSGNVNQINPNKVDGEVQMGMTQNGDVTQRNAEIQFAATPEGRIVQDGAEFQMAASSMGTIEQTNSNEKVAFTEGGTIMQRGGHEMGASVMQNGQVYQYGDNNGTVFANFLGGNSKAIVTPGTGKDGIASVISGSGNVEKIYESPGEDGYQIGFMPDSSDNVVLVENDGRKSKAPNNYLVLMGGNNNTVYIPKPGDSKSPGTLNIGYNADSMQNARSDDPNYRAMFLDSNGNKIYYDPVFKPEIQKLIPNK